jgi:predicted RNase H-like HicB family nuclease
VEIPVLIEPVAGNGFRATSGPPLGLTAEGPTRDEALQNLRRLIRERLAAGSEVAALELADRPAGNPWVEFAGMFRDDPYFDEWQAAIAENRRKADEDADLP